MDKNSPRQNGDSPSVYTCIGDDLCYLNSFPNGFFQYGCGKTEWAATVLTSYSGYNGSPKLQILYTGTGDASSSTVAPSSTAASSSAASSGASSGAAAGSSKVGGSSAAPAATSSGAAASDDSGSSSKPVGAIAGGTVGGIAALALVGALIFFFMRRRKNNNSDPKSTVTDISGNNNNGNSFHDPSLGGAVAATPYPHHGSPPIDQPFMAELDTPKPHDSIMGPPSSVSPVSELESPKTYNRDSAAWSALAGRQSVPPLEAPQEAVEMP